MDVGFKVHKNVAWASARMTSRVEWLGWDRQVQPGREGPDTHLAGALVLLLSEHDSLLPV